MPIPAGFTQHTSGYLMRLSDASGPYTFDGTTSSLLGGLFPTSFSSGNVANSSAIATIPAVAAKTTFITGFEITGAGATAGVVVLATITGLLGGTASYAVAAPAGAMIGLTPMTVVFNPPLPASAVNTAIVLTLPALGLGNTNAAVVAHGYSV